MGKEPRRILLVAHNSFTSAAWAKELRLFDAEIMSCEEIEAAQALLSHTTAHILITDLIFDATEGLKGLKLAHHVATHFPETLIVAICKKQNDEIRQLALKAGAHLVVEENTPLKEIIFERLKHSLFFKKTTHSLQQNTVHHLSRLDDFLNTNNIKALLQPIVSLRVDTFPTLGMESLARGPESITQWNPEIIFAYAAKKELLFDTDMFCIKAALEEAKSFKNQGKLFINVSSCSFINPQFSSKVAALCENLEYQNKNIVFELTEQQAIVNQKAFFLTLKELRRNGFTIALDDFGVGYANLQLVQDLKPNYIKLSGIFCRNLEKNKTKQTIVKAITQMATHLKIPTILERIETKAELEIAHTLGIDYAQGYYFCYPQKSQELIQSNWFLNHPFLTTF